MQRASALNMVMASREKEGEWEETGNQKWKWIVKNETKIFEGVETRNGRTRGATYTLDQQMKGRDRVAEAEPELEPEPWKQRFKYVRNR
ncbi:hypothetical protein V6N13_077564 [Hibiscus sabdariffa]